MFWTCAFLLISLCLQEFVGFAAFRSEPPLPGQLLDVAMSRLMEPAPPEVPREGSAPSRRKGKTATATSKEEEEEEDDDLEDEASEEATRSLEGEEGDGQ